MKCIHCNKELSGRSDKKYCDQYCKSARQYQLKKKDEGLFLSIERQLKKNRTLLKYFNRAGKSVIRQNKLIEAGFNPAYFTHYWKNSKGDVYLFCYEYGFFKRSENGKAKFVLVEWQDYMNPSN